MPSETRATPTEILREWDFRAEKAFLDQIQRDLQAQKESSFCFIAEYDEKNMTIYQQFPQKLPESSW